MSRLTQHAFEPEEIMAYLDGELEARQAAALASHFDHCPECQVLAAHLRQVSERLLEFQIEPCPARALEPILEAIATREVEQPRKATSDLKPKRRRRLRIFIWVAASALALLLVAAVSVPNLLRTRMAALEDTPERRERARLQQVIEQQARANAGELSVDSTRLPAAPPPPAPPINGSSRSLSALTTLATPGIAADSNGIFHGLGDHAQNSFSVDGQPLTDQQSKIFSNGPMIVQTASITLLAANYDQSSGAIQSLAAKHGGYAQDITANSQTGSARSLSATLRVPEKQLEALLADLRKLGHVEQETRNNQEITGQYVDLTARLKTSRAAEQRILELLRTKTGNLNEVLQAEEELARVRGQIESMDGQRANMEHQVRYATVQVQLSEEYREQLNPESFSTGRRLRNSLVEGLGNLAGGITGAAIFAFAYGPSILFWLGLLAVPAWFIWRRLKRAKSA